MATEYTPEQIKEILKRLSEFEGSPELAASAADMKTLTDALALLNEGNSLAPTLIEKVGEAMVSLSEKVKELEDPLTKFDSALKRTFKTLTGVTDASNTLVGSFFKMKSEGKSNKEVFEQLKKTANETFTALNVGTSIVRKIGESTFAMAKANDEATAAFNKTTGAAGAYDKELVSLQMSNIQHGISTAAMGESYGALQNSLSGFGVMAESERMRLGELGAQFAQVGVSGADFAGTLQTMTRGFGMSTRAATGMQEEAMALAQTLGKDVGTVLSEMNAALPQLASYGSDAVDMFFDLEKQAQRTGLAVGDLIGIAGQYRTFDSAAEAAGNLNAVLGTQLFSTMGLLEAQLEGPEAVLTYMTENLSDSIGDWDSLSTFHKEAVANAAGMNVEQMNNLMNQKAMTKEEKERAESLADTMAAGRSLWNELTIFAQNFAIAVTPIINRMVDGFQLINAGIAQISETLGPLMNILKIMGTLWAGAFAIGGIMKAVSALKTLTAGIYKEIAARITLNAMKGPLGWAMMATGGIVAAGAYSKYVKGRDKHRYGTDRTMANPEEGEPIMVGEQGPELLVTPPNSAVVNNTTMTALAEQGAGGGGNNAQVVAAVQALGVKLDTMITKLGSNGDFVLEVAGESFGRIINQHLGENGSQPIRLKTT